MQGSETLFWLQQGEERRRVLLALSQPMTADQLARRTEKSRSSVSEHLRQMRIYQVVTCLNPLAHQSRVYGLTEAGTAHRDYLAQMLGGANSFQLPTVNWQTYGDSCFRHRRAVLLVLKDRMRPPQVKRRALSLDARLRMSVDNCREVLYWMLKRGLVRVVPVRSRRFVFYELTKEGKACQELLRRAETRDAG